MGGSQLLYIVALLICIGATEGLKCYSCQYTDVVPTYNPFCSEDFDNTTSGARDAIVECSGICVKESGTVNDVSGLERKCNNTMTLAECAQACGTVKFDGGYASGCQHCCNTDLCNSASSVTFDLLAVVAMLGLVWSWS